MAGMCGVDLFGVCNGLWPDGTAPMGPRDASEGMPTVACATCGQNRNPRSFASVDFDMPIEPQRQAVEHSEVAATTSSRFVAIHSYQNPIHEWTVAPADFPNDYVGPCWSEEEAEAVAFGLNVLYWKNGQ